MIKKYFQNLSLAKRLALLSASLCLGFSLILVIVSILSSRYILEQQQQLYGQSLSSQLAARAGDALINNDRVSLQAIVSQYVQNTPATKGTIYNVSRQAIVRAGSASPQAISYSSPISFEDSIAGYAVISQETSSLNSSRQDILISLLFLSGLAALFNFAVIVRSGQALVYRLNKIIFALHSKQGFAEQEASPWQDEIENLRQEVEKLPLEQLSTNQGNDSQPNEIQEGSLLFIHFTNLKTYRNQLGATALEDYTRLLQQVLTHIAKLYGATISSCRECSAIMIFDGKQASSNVCFSAASSAWLLTTVLSELEGRYQLKLGAEMAATEITALTGDSFDLYLSLEKEDLIDTLAHYCQQQPNKILLTESCVADSGDSLSTEHSGIAGVYELTGFPRFENSALRHQQTALVKQISASLPVKI